MNIKRNDPLFKGRRRELRASQTESEKKLWLKIRNRQLRDSKFFRQYSVGTYIIDFYCPACKLAVELDGGQHNEDKNIEQDLERTRYFNNLGIRVFRVWNNDMMQNLEGVIEELIRILNVSE